MRCQFHQRFYVQIFRTNLVSAAFSSYVLALAKKLNEKHAQKNVDEIDGRSQFHQRLRARFLYKFLASS